MLHSKCGEISIAAGQFTLSRCDWEANIFAAELLMPENEFKKAMGMTQDVQSLAAKFLVSPRAAAVRRRALEQRENYRSDSV